MNKNEFLTQMQDILQRDDASHETDVLADYEEWDSLSKMAVMAYFYQTFGIKITLAEMSALQNVSDLIRLAGDNVR